MSCSQNNNEKIFSNTNKQPPDKHLIFPGSLKLFSFQTLCYMLFFIKRLCNQKNKSLIEASSLNVVLCF